MPFCSSCGAPVEGRFCAKCGSPVEGAASPAGGSAPASPVAAGTAQAMADNVASMLCYILGFITGIIFLVMEPYKRNRAVRFHAYQSIFLSVAFFAAWIVFQVFAGMLTAVHLWFLLPLVALVGLFIWMGGLVLTVLLMVKAYQGKTWVLPVIGPLAQKQA